MANFPWFFSHFEDSFLLSLFLLFFPHIWPYLWNYWSDWSEIFCESRFWPSGGTHQITAFKVEGCRRYWVVRPECRWCARIAGACTYKFSMPTFKKRILICVGWQETCVWGLLPTFFLDMGAMCIVILWPFFVHMNASRRSFLWVCC